MNGLFKRAAMPDLSGLGTRLLALPLPAGCTIPAGCVAVVTGAGGSSRRVGEGARLALSAGESGCCFHPGQYTADLQPFAAAPEVGLRCTFAVDSPDPRVAQQRFDLYLASEASGPVELAAFARAIEAALQRELAQGNLELPPCTSFDEWNAFRSGFNRLLYMRFGVAVDDCVPVDLADSRDFARELLARSDAQVLAAPAPQAVTAQAFDPALVDERALRRLFLELPDVMLRLRLAPLPPGLEWFRLRQALLARLDHACLAVGTMPALALSAPGRPLADAMQSRRAGHSARAAGALDEAWALLARLEVGHAGPAALLDEADRIVANLEHALDARRSVSASREAA